MSNPPFNNLKSAADPAGLSNLRAELPTIKILLYTDDPNTTDNFGPLSLGTMIEHLNAHAPTFANLCIEFKCRTSADGSQIENRLEAQVIEKYDEIWFFGRLQVSRKNSTLGVLRGGPNSELGEDEVSALNCWMQVDEKNHGGGVLMTGDHSQKPPPDAQPDQKGVDSDDSTQAKFLGLGRAIGRCVPRAGLLRAWEGRPTNNKRDSFNTQVMVSGIDVEDSRLQLDVTPQRLILRYFDATGKPAPDGQPHPLFLYKNGELIRVFPDHKHEGAVVIPKKFDEKVWPKRNAVQPKPHVVAYGIDERNCRLLKLVAAYDGDSAYVGRIVADSTWHHYFNANLSGFPSPAPQGSAADQIGQYYGNLAVWLAPRSKRQEMARVMIQWMATNPHMLEEICNDRLSIGSAAYALLLQVASPCEINELLQAAVPDDYREKYETLSLPERGFALSPFPSKELICGSVVDWYQGEMIKIESSDDPEKRLVVVDVIDVGFRNAFDEQTAQLMRMAENALKLIGKENRYGIL